MKLRELLRWLNDALRPPHAQGEGYHPPLGKTHAVAKEAASPNWDASQQDERQHS
jgi:hypothetical protein